MAFLRKMGTVLKQTTSAYSSTELLSSRPSLFNAIRYMSSSKLFVGGLSYGMDENSLRQAFGKYGEVVEARIIVDRETGNSRGFGFITYTSSEEASSAIQAMDGQDLHGRRVRVNYASDRPRPNYGGFGGGGYGGGGDGYGGGGYGGGGYGGGGGGGFGGNSGGFGADNYRSESNQGGFSNASSFGGDGSTAGFGDFGDKDKSNDEMDDFSPDDSFEPNDKDDDFAKRA